MDPLPATRCALRGRATAEAPRVGGRSRRAAHTVSSAVLVSGWCATGLLFLAGVAGAGADDSGGACFDLSGPVTEPLRPPIPLLVRSDNTAFATYPNGIDWAAARAVIGQPIEVVYLKLLDHRNVKDMQKTKLETQVFERPGLLQYHLVSVVVTLNAVFFKKTIAWSEEWGFSLAEGTREKPDRIVASYQRVGGTKYLKHQCGSYVLQRLGEDATDISMYEEVKATRRSARDTMNMQLGILRHLRNGEPAAAMPRCGRSWPWPSGGAATRRGSCSTSSTPSTPRRVPHGVRAR